MISVLLEVLPFSGRLIDTFRGNQFSEQFAPELGNRDSVLEVFISICIPALIFQGPYFQEFMKVVNNFNNAGLLQEEGSYSWRKVLSLDNILLVTEGVFDVALLIVFPLVLLALSLELCLGIFQKIYSKFQLGAELALIRTGLGVLLLFFLIRSENVLFWWNSLIKDVLDGIS